MQAAPGTSLTEPRGDEPAPRRRKQVWWVLIAVLVWVLDQATKWWASHHLADGQPHRLVGSLFQLRLTHNSGAAFSVATGYTVVLTVIALVVIVVGVRLANRLRSAWWAVAMGLLLGGAAGNVTDRIFRPPAPFQGHVVDFMELPHWPIFNVADSAVSVAAVLIVVLSFRGVHLDGSVGPGKARPAGVTSDSATADEGEPPAGDDPS